MLCSSRNMQGVEGAGVIMCISKSMLLTSVKDNNYKKYSVAIPHHVNMWRSRIKTSACGYKQVHTSPRPMEVLVSTVGIVIVWEVQMVGPKVGPRYAVVV